jgi:hypothetical protein
MRRAAGAVADDDEIGVERLEIPRGVLERLALFERGRLGGKIDDVGAQPLAASSKLMRVRVDGSTNRLTTVLPRSAGLF